MQSVARLYLPLALLVAFVLAPQASAAGRIRYTLQNLRPLSISQYSLPTRAAQREYIHFQNAQGNHTVIYEEALGTPAIPAILNVRKAIGHLDLLCSVDLDCKSAAFCTGSCKNLYYETSNTPHDEEMLSRNHCDVLSFHCEKPAALPVTAVNQGKP